MTLQRVKGMMMISFLGLDDDELLTGPTPILKCFEASDGFIFAENCQVWKIQNICNFLVQGILM
jgi:hypothetical protein